MTNSRLTDPEVLEWRFPVILENFSIRRGSGGKGSHRGGDGAKRTIRVREKRSVSILSTHLIVAPFGLNVGGDAALGKNYILRADGGGENHTAPRPTNGSGASGDRGGR